MDELYIVARRVLLDALPATVLVRVALEVLALARLSDSGAGARRETPEDVPDDEGAGER